MFRDAWCLRRDSSAVIQPAGAFRLLKSPMPLAPESLQRNALTRLDSSLLQTQMLTTPEDMKCTCMIVSGSFGISHLKPVLRLPQLLVRPHESPSLLQTIVVSYYLMAMHHDMKTNVSACARAVAESLSAVYSNANGTLCIIPRTIAASTQ
jgi:UTP:GlnB (protein PII) uridylyltransferase